MGDKEDQSVNYKDVAMPTSKGWSYTKGKAIRIEITCDFNPSDFETAILDSHEIIQWLVKQSYAYTVTLIEV